MRYETIEELTESLSDMYEVDNIQSDYENGNVDLDDVDTEKYYIPHIVADSFINGQKAQAVSQYRHYGLLPSQLDEYLPAGDIVKLMEMEATR